MFPDVLHQAIRDALAAAHAAGEIADLSDLTFVVERPRDRSHGDWATNAAMVAARPAKAAPRVIAQAIVDHFGDVEHVTGLDIAGPGFVNITLDRSWYVEVLTKAALGGPEHARGEPGSGEKIQVEFVSSNPNGPLHIGHARGGVIGDVLCRLFEYVGHTVEREYYYNDAGVQMDHYADSLEARYLQALGQDVEFPEHGYPGQYVIDWAAEAVTEMGDAWLGLEGGERRRAIRAWGLARAMRDIEETLELARIPFDSWFSETTLHDRGDVAEAIAELDRHGHLYRKDGATWFRTTDYGDEKDRVLVKSDGTFTYISPDIAYHLDKFNRGFDRLINIWGADHHGYIPRMKAAVTAMGFDPDRLEILITQTVNLFREGEPVRMSMRAGEFVTFREVLEEVGTDPTRYELSAYSPDTAISFDLEAVNRESMDNPVYYLQYAHARMRSLEGFAAEQGITRVPFEDADLSRLDHPAEIELLKQMDRLGEEVAEAARRRAPHRVTGYGQDVATAFHRFYADCRIVTDDPAVTQARLWLVEGAKSVLLAVLGILGMSAPERM